MIHVIIFISIIIIIIMLIVIVSHTCTFPSFTLPLPRITILHPLTFNVSILYWIWTKFVQVVFLKKRTFSIALRVLPLGPMSKPIKFRPGWSSWNTKKKWKNIWFNNLTLTIMSRSQPPHLHLTDSRSRPVGSWLCPWSWLSAHCSPVVSCNRDWSSEHLTWSARFPINFNFPTSISTIASCRDFSNSALFLKERKVRLLFLI